MRDQQPQYHPSWNRACMQRVGWDYEPLYSLVVDGGVAYAGIEHGGTSIEFGSHSGLVARLDLEYKRYPSMHAVIKLAMAYLNALGAWGEFKITYGNGKVCDEFYESVDTSAWGLFLPKNLTSLSVTKKFESYYSVPERYR